MNLIIIIIIIIIVFCYYLLFQFYIKFDLFHFNLIIKKLILKCYLLFDLFTNLFIIIMYIPRLQNILNVYDLKFKKIIRS